MFFRLSVFQSFVDLVFCQCPCALSTFYMLASVSGLCRAESSIIQVLVSTLSPSHAPRCSGSSWLRKPSDVYSSVNSWLLRLTQPIVLRLLLFLGTICICVDSIACPFELTRRVSLTYYCECTWHLSQLNFAVPETYCDGVAQTENFRQALFSAGEQWRVERKWGLLYCSYRAFSSDYTFFNQKNSHFLLYHTYRRKKLYGVVKIVHFVG
jgi:hypothetical protein